MCGVLHMKAPPGSSPRRSQSLRTDRGGSRVGRCCQTRGRGFVGAWPQLWGGESASLLTGRPLMLTEHLLCIQYPRRLRG